MKPKPADELQPTGYSAAKLNITCSVLPVSATNIIMTLFREVSSLPVSQRPTNRGNHLYHSKMDVDVSF